MFSLCIVSFHHVSFYDCQAEYNNLTLTDLKEELKSPPAKERFKKKRAKAIEIVRERGEGYQFGPEDFEVPEEVNVSEKTGERRSAGGYLYPLELFKETFPEAKRKGTIPTWIRLSLSRKIQASGASRTSRQRSQNSMLIWRQRAMRPESNVFDFGGKHTMSKRMMAKSWR